MTNDPLISRYQTPNSNVPTKESMETITMDSFIDNLETHTLEIIIPRTPARILRAARPRRADIDTEEYPSFLDEVCMDDLQHLLIVNPAEEDAIEQGYQQEVIAEEAAAGGALDPEQQQGIDEEEADEDAIEMEPEMAMEEEAAARDARNPEQQQAMDEEAAGENAIELYRVMAIEMERADDDTGEQRQERENEVAEEIVNEQQHEMANEPAEDEARELQDEWIVLDEWEDCMPEPATDNRKVRTNTHSS